VAHLRNGPRVQQKRATAWRRRWAPNLIRLKHLLPNIFSWIRLCRQHYIPQQSRRATVARTAVARPAQRLLRRHRLRTAANRLLRCHRLRHPARRLLRSRRLRLRHHRQRGHLRPLVSTTRDTSGQYLRPLNHQRCSSTPRRRMPSNSRWRGLLPCWTIWARYRKVGAGYMRTKIKVRGGRGTRGGIQARGHGDGGTGRDTAAAAGAEFLSVTRRHGAAMTDHLRRTPGDSLGKYGLGTTVRGSCTRAVLRVGGNVITS